MPTDPSRLYTFDPIRGAFLLPVDHPRRSTMRAALSWLVMAHAAANDTLVKRTLQNLCPLSQDPDDHLLVMARMVDQQFDERMASIEGFRADNELTVEELRLLEQQSIECVLNWVRAFGAVHEIQHHGFQNAFSALLSVARHCGRVGRMLNLMLATGSAGLTVLEDHAHYGRNIGEMPTDDGTGRWVIMVNDTNRDSVLMECGGSICMSLDRFGRCVFWQRTPSNSNVTDRRFLFAVSLFRPERVAEVARQSNLHDLLVSLPQKAFLPSPAPAGSAIVHTIGLTLMRSFRAYADENHGLGFMEGSHLQTTYARKAGISRLKWNALRNQAAEFIATFSEMLRSMPVLRRGQVARDVEQAGRNHPLHPDSDESIRRREAEARAAAAREEAARARAREEQIRQAMRRMWDWSDIPPAVSQIMQTDLTLHLDEPTEN